MPALRSFKFWPLLVFPLFLQSFGQAADDPRPICSSENHGRMWPEAANHDPKLIAHLVRCGELLVCVHGTWHYHWEAQSVRIDQLGRHAKSKPAATPVGDVRWAAEAPQP